MENQRKKQILQKHFKEKHIPSKYIKKGMASLVLCHDG